MAYSNFNWTFQMLITLRLRITFVCNFTRIFSQFRAQNLFNLLNNGDLFLWWIFVTVAQVIFRWQINRIKVHCVYILFCVSEFSMLRYECSFTQVQTLCILFFLFYCKCLIVLPLKGEMLIHLPATKCETGIWARQYVCDLRCSLRLLSS